MYFLHAYGTQRADFTDALEERHQQGVACDHAHHQGKDYHDEAADAVEHPDHLAVDLAVVPGQYAPGRIAALEVTIEFRFDSGDILNIVDAYHQLCRPFAEIEQVVLQCLSEAGKNKTLLKRRVRREGHHTADMYQRIALISVDRLGQQHQFVIELHAETFRQSETHQNAIRIVCGQQFAGNQVFAVIGQNGR